MVDFRRKFDCFQDSTRFGLFLMCFNTAYKFVLCTMRRWGSLDDRINAPVAGFLSALTLAMDSANRREFMTFFIMARALDSSIRLAKKSGVIKNIGRTEFVLWLICNAFLQSAMGLKQGILNESIRNFMKSWAQLS